MKYFSILGIFFFLSCGPELTREDLLPEAGGLHGEIILLMENDLFSGRIGEAVVAQLSQNAKGVYLRPEPMFSFIRMRPKDLDHLNQLKRNILKIVVDFDSTYAETAVIEKRNYFAKNQLFVIIKDSDPDRLYDYVAKEFNYVLNLFNDFEMEQLKREYLNNPNKNIKQSAETNFGISISIPKEAELRVDSSDFMWVKRDRSKQVMGNITSEPGSQTYWIQQGVLIWSQPYKDTNQLTVNGTLQIRDTVLKYHVPGKVKGSYMATEYDPYYCPKGKVFNYKGAYAVEIRGIWKHDGHPGAFGGGPFVQYSIHNESKGTVVTVCGYVYGPKYDKREYIREIDAMLNTIEVLE